MELVAVILAVFAVLQIILFFKLWGMTNNVAQIKKEFLKYVNQKANVKVNEPINNESIIPNGTLVVELKTESQMVVKERLENGHYVCTKNAIPIGNFSESELMEFDKWVNERF